MIITAHEISAANEVKEQRSSYVYFIFARKPVFGDAFVKIGISYNPVSRVRAIAVNCPFPFFKIGVVKMPSRGMSRLVEKALHKRFKDRRTSGEWFKVHWSDQAKRGEFIDQMGQMLDLLVPGWKMLSLDVEAVNIKQAA